MAEPRFPGKVVVLGNKEFTIPAISLGKLKLLQPKLEQLKIDEDGALAPESLDTVVELTLAALNRNYPEMTKAEVEELLDLGNVAEIMKVVTGQAGLERAGKPVLEGSSL